MIINSKVIKDMKACKDRYDNYVNQYGDKDYDVNTFLDLENITYNDKMWVTSRILNINQSRTFAILCAESVLHIFEEKYPDDLRPRQCLEYLKSVKDFSNMSAEEKSSLAVHRKAAYSAAYAAYDAARAAAHATAYAAYAAYPAYAADAADAAVDAATNKKEQQDLNITFLKQVMGT